MPDLRLLCLLPAALVAACAPTPVENAPGEPGDGAADPVDAAAARTAVGSGERFFVRYEPQPDPIPLNESFELVLDVRSAEDRESAVAGLELYVQGWMPDHLHGMNRTTTVEDRGDGTYGVEGMLFHMPGHWEIHVDLIDGGIAERATFEVDL